MRPFTMLSILPLIGITATIAGATPDDPLTPAIPVPPSIEVSFAQDAGVLEGEVHRHHVVMDLGRTPRRRVRVDVELEGARRGPRISRHVALGVVSVAAAFTSGPAARAVSPFLGIANERLRDAGDSVFSVGGSRLETMGGGLHELTFRCVHRAPPEPRIRITLHAVGDGDSRDWRFRSSWMPLTRGEGARDALFSNTGTAPSRNTP